MKPEYPVYVISKNRFNNCLTAKFLIKDQVPFYLVVEPQEFNQYAEQFGTERILTLPFANLGLGSTPARNWVWEHSIAEGHKRHWILDDNISGIYRRYKAVRIPCESGPALRYTEIFTDRYQNIGISGLNYSMFAPDRQKVKPFVVNHHVYSCLLIQNDLSIRWRGRYNEDTDLCLQVIASGLCTVLVSVFLIQKRATMTMKGGNTDELYANDGRLRMARSLERVWPYVVTTGRRFRRPQHLVRNTWKKFDTPLIPKSEIELKNLPDGKDILKLVARSEVKSPFLRNLISDADQNN